MLHLLNDNDILIVNRTLACVLGVNGSIALRQLNYWLELNRKAKRESHFRDSCWWAWNTIAEWQAENFPFWSDDTITRTFDELEELGLIVKTSVYNARYPMDKTLWYTIDYTAYEQFMALWDEYERPIRNGRTQSEQYKLFMLHWSAVCAELWESREADQGEIRTDPPIPQTAVSIPQTAESEIRKLRVAIPETTHETTTDTFAATSDEDDSAPPAAVVKPMNGEGKSLADLPQNPYPMGSMNWARWNAQNNAKHTPHKDEDESIDEQPQRGRKLGKRGFGKGSNTLGKRAASEEYEAGDPSRNAPAATEIAFIKLIRQYGNSTPLSGLNKTSLTQFRAPVRVQRGRVWITEQCLQERLADPVFAEWAAIEIARIGNPLINKGARLSASRAMDAIQQYAVFEAWREEQARNSSGASVAPANVPVSNAAPTADEIRLARERQIERQRKRQQAQ